MMKYLFFSVSGLIFTVKIFAQAEGEIPTAPDPSVIKVNSNSIYGRLIDNKTRKGIANASVELYSSSVSARITGMRDSAIGITLSQPKGDFTFSSISSLDSFRLVITALGYKKMDLPVIIHRNKNEKNSRAIIQKDLGNLELEHDVQQLGMVTVVAQKPLMEMGVDRKIFNVDKNITTAGGTGLDIMKNIPSVSVDVDGTVELRNSAPQIFVDGRPTILTLDQIPASDIDRVEVITNPSAKFDAATSGGIINIILKKNRRLGLNGILSAGGGFPGILNGNLSLSLRQGKFNFFATGSYNRSAGKAKGETLRENKRDGQASSFFNQYSLDDRLRRFTSARFGADYFLDNRNTISLSQNIVRGRFGDDGSQYQENFDSVKTLQYYGQRSSVDRNRFDRNTTNLNYTHKFPREGKELSASINYNYGNGGSHTDIYNAYFNPDKTTYRNSDIVTNDGTNKNNQWTFQADFTDPKGKDSKFESGVRSYINNYSSVFNSYSLSNGNPVKLPLSNDYKYREIINAFYITYTNKWKEIGYQLGLRTEQSKFDGELVDSALKFGYNYPDKLNNLWNAMFPSVFLTKQLDDKNEVQLNYSRRIRRPNFWQMNPFIDISDPANLRQGNPQLQPEFSNSFEFNYNLKYGRGSNFLSSVYYRNNRGDITNYSDTITAAQYQQLNNAAVDRNAIVNTFINAQSTNRFGAEFTLQQKIGNNFDITPTLEFQYRKVNARIHNLDLNNEGFNWESKVMANYKIQTNQPSLWNNLSFQFMGEYRSPQVIPQGKRAERHSIDLAMKKEFMKNKRASITFNVNDVFNSYRYGTIYDTDNFHQYSYGRWNVRTFRAVFTYKFGKTDFTLSKKNNNRDDNRGDD